MDGSFSLWGKNSRLRALLAASLAFHLLGAPPALYLVGRPSAPEPDHRFELSLEQSTEEEQRPREEQPPPLVESAAAASPRPSDMWPAADLAPPDAPELPSRPSLDWYPEVASVPLDAWRVPAAAQPIGPSAAGLSPPPPGPEETAEPAAPRFADSPPPSLMVGLGRGYLTAVAGETVFSQDAREELRRRVYARHRYPREAVEMELEGDVIVRFRLDAEGTPTDISVPQPGEGLALLEEQALRMVREGGPYPVATTRRKVEFFVAMAYLNTDERSAARIAVVRPSGLEAVDRFAAQLGASDARADPETGWKVVEFRVSATLEKSGDMSEGAGVRVIDLDGDQRWRQFLEANSSRLPAPPEQTDYFTIPIRFRFSD